MTDSLADSLSYALSLYGIQADIEGIRSQTAGHATRVEPKDVVSIAEKLSVRATLERIPFRKLKRLELPAIILLKGGHSCVLHPQHTHKGTIYRPGQKQTDADLAALAKSYTGHAILLSPASAEQSGTKNPSSNWFWKPIISNWGSYSEVLICTLAINLFVLALPLYTMNVYDSVVPIFAEETLFVLTGGVMLALLFDFLFKSARLHILENVAGRVGNRYDFMLLERLLLLPPLDRTLSVGEGANLFKELQTIRQYYATNLMPALVDFPFFFLFVYIIHVISPLLGTIPLIAAGLLLLINLLIHIPARLIANRHFATVQQKMAYLIETLDGADAIKVNNAIGNRLLRWNAKVIETEENARKSQIVMATGQNLSMMIAQAVSVFIIFFGVYEIQADRLTIGGLIASTILASRSIAPLINASSVLARLRQSSDILKNINKIFSIPHEGDARRYPVKGHLNGRIEVKNASYRYDGQIRPAVDNIGFSIEPGEKVGLIGKKRRREKYCCPAGIRPAPPGSGNCID